MLWKSRNLTLEEKIIFKYIAYSKIIFQALITTLLNPIIKELEKIQNEFLWGRTNPKIKHDTLSSSYTQDGSKNTDMPKKIASLQCSWTRRLYYNYFINGNRFHFHLIWKSFGKCFKFHSNFSF